MVDAVTVLHERIKTLEAELAAEHSVREVTGRITSASVTGQTASVIGRTSW